MDGAVARMPVAARQFAKSIFRKINAVKATKAHSKKVPILMMGIFAPECLRLGKLSVDCNASVLINCKWYTELAPMSLILVGHK